MTLEPRVSMAVGAVSAFERLMLCAWAGGAWFAGFVVAPQLFSVMPPSQAGTLAGTLFTAVFWLSLPALGFSLLVVGRDARSRARRITLGLLLSALALSVINEWVLHPWITAMREDMAARGRWFGTAHGLSSAIYFINCGLAAAIVVRRR